MGWDEWEQLKSDAVARGKVGMQLNEAPPEGDAREQGDLSVTEGELTQIGNNAYQLWERLSRTGHLADTSTDSASSDLQGQNLKLGTALRHVHKRWDSQVKSLSDACAQISNHMDFTKNAHSGDEHYIGGQLSSIATLSEGFDNVENKDGRK